MTGFGEENFVAINPFPVVYILLLIRKGKLTLGGNRNGHRFSYFSPKKQTNHGKRQHVS
jgi:hypothetical protein